MYRNCPEIGTVWLYGSVLCSKDVDRMGTNIDLDLMALSDLGLQSGSSLFAQSFLARLDEVQEELLYYPRRWRRWRHRL